MAITSSRVRLSALLLVAAILTMGCNPLLLPYFLMPMDPKYPATMLKLHGTKRKPAKVVILAYLASDSDANLVKLDRDIASSLARQLQQGCKDSDEKIEIVPPRLVERFKDEHANWNEMELAEVGKHFEADYVIYLEIDGVSLYEKGSGNLMFRGRTDVSVVVQDMSKPDDEPMSKPFRCEYPPRGPVTVDDANLEGFRHAFVEYVAQHLSWYFTAHTSKAEFACD